MFEYGILLGGGLRSGAQAVAAEPLMWIGAVALALGGYTAYGVKGSFIFLGAGVLAYVLWNDMLPF